VFHMRDLDGLALQLLPGRIYQLLQVLDVFRR